MPLVTPSAGEQDVKAPTRSCDLRDLRHLRVRCQEVVSGSRAELRGGSFADPQCAACFASVPPNRALKSIQESFERTRLRARFI